MRLNDHLANIVNFFVGLAALILGLRVVFRLFNANPTADFVQWIYSTSDALMVPFRGIFPAAELERGVVLDVSAIFALIMYIAIGALLLALVGAFSSGGRDTVVVADKPARRR